LLVIDAKDWASPVDVNDVGAFSAVLRDVRASSGMLVCNAGFTANAQVYAKNLGISLTNLHDAESRDWSRDLTVPIIWSELTPQLSFAGLIRFEAGDSPLQDDDFPFILSPDDGQSIAKPLSTFERKWNAGQLRRDLGTTHWLSDERSFKALVRTSAGEREWRPVHKFALSYTVKRDAWLGQFRPSECRGLIDYLDEQSFLVSYMPLNQIPATRDESWTPIEDTEQVALATRGSIVTTELVQILDASGIVVGELDLSLWAKPYQTQMICCFPTRLSPLDLAFY
jgi:Restriction endonuclease